LGKETSRVLSKCGATVIMAARDVEKGKLAKEEIEKETNEKVHLIPLDLGEFSTIETFVDDFKKLNLPLHILINNAGVMATPQRKTKDGFEYQFGINHYGHFKLTMELLPMMVETAKKGDFEGRIVVLSSMAHKSGTQKINFDDIHWTKPGSYCIFLISF
jgi:WW domain-containing oxidoreductase